MKLITCIRCDNGDTIASAPHTGMSHQAKTIDLARKGLLKKLVDLENHCVDAIHKMQRDLEKREH